MDQTVSMVEMYFVDGFLSKVFLRSLVSISPELLGESDCVAAHDKYI